MRRYRRLHYRAVWTTHSLCGRERAVWTETVLKSGSGHSSGGNAAILWSTPGLSTITLAHGTRIKVCWEPLPMFFFLRISYTYISMHTYAVGNFSTVIQ
uniref:Secreted protein n=1 Tax=Steinernema glaseri TaxID=37863 RepID=A0A1I7YC30_9BILA